MRKATLGFGTASPGATKSPRVQPLSLVFTQHRPAWLEHQLCTRIRRSRSAGIAGHVTETIGHDAETAGHDEPKYPNSWFGIFAPAQTPRPVVEKVYEEVSGLLRMDDVQSTLRTQGAEPIGSKPEEFSRFFKAEVEKLGKLISDVGARVD